MKVRRRLIPCAALLLLTQPVFAAVNPWFGTWKLNREKSTMTGDTYTIAKIGDRYRMDFGAGRFDLKDDGQDYPMMPSRTISLRKTGDKEWLQVTQASGQEISRTTMVLSSDGKALTSHTTGTHADGSTYSSDTTDARVGAGSGLSGTWKTIKKSSSEPETLIYSDAGEGAMRMESTEDKSVIITRLDGKPALLEGPNAVPDETMAVKATSRTSYTWTVFMKGKPYVKGVNAISADGKAFKEINWLVVRPGEKYTMIYERSSAGAHQVR